MRAAHATSGTWTQAGSAPGTPLAKKLGLISAKASVVTLMGEPAGFRSCLKDVPSNVRFLPRLGPETNLAICFVRSLADLNHVLDLLSVQLPPAASAWIVRPKQHLNPGFNGNDVREGGLARELVDYKICSVDDNWSGVKFARRKPVRVSKA